MNLPAATTRSDTTPDPRSSTSRPASKPTATGVAGRVPCLDGLRAVAILFVIFSHALAAATRGKSDPWLFLLWGQIGTSSFFAISGLLITLLLLREHRAHGTIDFKLFFARRALRILPPLWVFLLVSVIVAPLFRPAFRVDQLLKVLLFVVDYAPTGTFWLDHTWSLGATEQFYLLWPFALLAALPNRAEKLAWWLMCLAPIFRLVGYLLGLPGTLAMAFHTIIDTFMIGCLMAILLDRDRRHWFLQLLGRGWTAALSVGFLLLGSPVLSHRFGGAYFASVGLTLRSLAIASIIMWASSSEDGPVRRFLTHRLIVRIGLMSYSLYLWQQPFFDGDVHATWVGSLPVALLGTFGLAELSYRFLELPLGRYRTRMLRATVTPRASAGTD
jgi:peptidoglycan/LPS O-acetylase OafA/YrhL